MFFSKLELNHLVLQRRQIPSMRTDFISSNMPCTQKYDTNTITNILLISSHCIYPLDLPYPKLHTLPLQKLTTYPQSTTSSIQIPCTDVQSTVQRKPYPYGCYYTTDEPVQAKQLMPLFGQWQQPLLKQYLTSNG
jgi:hypothetical protein